MSRIRTPLIPGGLLVCAALAACGSSSTTPIRAAVLRSSVSVDRTAFRVGDSLHVRVTVRNAGTADTVVASTCDRPMVTIVERNVGAVSWQFTPCSPPADARGLTIAAGDSVSAAFTYGLPAEGSFSVRGGILIADPRTLIATMQQPSDWVDFVVTP